MNYLSKHPALGIGVFFGGVTLAYWLPYVWGYLPFQSDYDLFLYYYPAFDFYSKALHLGQSFLWMPGLFSGFPIYASQVGGFFDPLNVLIFKLFSGSAGIQVRLILDTCLVLIASYGAARSLGLSRRTALLVGPSYLLAFDLRYLSNPVIANTLFLLPFLIWITIRSIDRGSIRWGYVALGGVGLGWAVLGGYTQLVVYATLLGALFTIGYGYSVEKHRTLRALLRRISTFVAIVVIGVGVGLPQIMPAYTFLPLSARGEVAEYEKTTLKVIDPGDLVLTVVPPHVYIPYVTAGRKPLFVGALWFVLALGALMASGAAFMRRRQQPLSDQHTRMLLVGGLFLFAFFAALKGSPVYALLAHLPVFELFRFPFRFMFLGAFFLALLGAFGLEYVRDSIRERWFRISAYTLSGVVAVGIGMLGVLQLSRAGWIETWIFRGVSILHGVGGLSKDLTHYREAVERGLDAYRELLSFANPLIAVPLVLLIAGLGMVCAVARGTLSVERFTAGAMVISVLTVIGIPMVEWTMASPRDLLQQPSVVARMTGDEGSSTYRSYSFLPEEASMRAIPPQYKLSQQEQIAFGELLLGSAAPNLNLLSGVRSVDGYDQFEPRSTLEALGHIGGELGAGYPSRSALQRKEALLAHLSLLGMMGGKYLVSGVPLEHPSLQFIATSSLSTYGMVLYEYRNTQAVPTYYLANKIEPVPHNNLNDLLVHVRPEWSSTTYVSCAECSPVRGAGRATLLRERNGDYEFVVTATGLQYMVLSETAVPGWRALVDGKEVPIVRANGLFMAVAVPKGKHAVRLYYTGMLQELSLLELLGIVDP